jgi:hypothetical protein
MEAPTYIREQAQEMQTGAGGDKGAGLEGKTSEKLAQLTTVLIIDLQKTCP